MTKTNFQSNQSGIETAVAWLLRVLPVSSNRTKVELKHAYDNAGERTKALPIEPKWN